MNKKLLIFFIIILLSFSVIAGDFEDGEEAYEREDYMAAIFFFKKSAEQGHAQAQHNLGVMYKLGQGIPQDYKQAMYWLQKAAVQGFAQAQYNLGVMYGKGLGVTQDYIEAYKWHSIASAYGMVKSRDVKDSIVKLMTPIQIESARKLAREWMEKHQQ